MKVYKTKQLSSDSLLHLKFDLFLTSSGYETRARHLVEKLGSKINSEARWCIQFENHSDLISRKLNDEIFSYYKFNTQQLSGNEDAFIPSLLDDAIKKKRDNKLNILVDYSCMTRIWYASILNYFRYTAIDNFEVNIFFSYSSSEFVKPPQATIYNRYVGPIEGFYSVTIPDKPTALVIGLGYVQSRAYGLSEFFDVEPFLFIADSSSNKKYYDEVVENNMNLIKGLSESHIFNYPLNNLLFTETLLNSLTRDLLTDYRVVLAPCGPKPFTLLCLITGMRLSDIDVWRISAGENDEPVDKPPSGYINLLHLSLR